MASKFGARDEARPGAQREESLEKEARPAVVPTGIIGFDDIMGGGLPAGNLYLLSGVLGSNTTLFAQQALYNTVIRKGKVTYYTVEHSSTDIIQDMQLYGMDVQEYIDDGSWVFARVVPKGIKKVLEALPEVPMEQRIDVGESLSNLMNHFHDSAKEGRNTAIHLPQLIRSFPLEEVQNLLFFMAGVARKYGGAHFLLMTEGAHEEEYMITIKDVVDTVFEFSAEVRGAEIENTITIQKVRGVLPKMRLIRLTARENGLITETIRRV